MNPTNKIGDIQILFHQCIWFCQTRIDYNFKLPVECSKLVFCATLLQQAVCVVVHGPLLFLQSLWALPVECSKFATSLTSALCNLNPDPHSCARQDWCSSDTYAITNFRWICLTMHNWKLVCPFDHNYNYFSLHFFTVFGDAWVCRPLLNPAIEPLFGIKLNILQYK